MKKNFSLNKSIIFIILQLHRLQQRNHLNQVMFDLHWKITSRN